MKILIRPFHIAGSIPSEDELLDCSAIESIYAIRKLRAAILYQGMLVEVGEPNQHGQVFLGEFDIWINKEDYWPVDAKTVV